MSEVYSKIYKLNIYMQEMKSSFKLSQVKTEGWLFYFFTFISQSTDWNGLGEVEAWFFSKSYRGEV